MNLIFIIQHLESLNQTTIKSNSFFKNNWNLTAAYKKYDVKSYYKTGLKEKPIQPRNIIFFNYGIESNKVNDKNWKFDITFNRLGKQRLMLNPRDNFELVNPAFILLTRK